MIYENVMLHNAADLKKIDGLEGQRLLRVPRDVQRHLNDRAKNRVEEPVNAEIRFVSSDPQIKVTLSAPEGENRVHLYHGGFKIRDFLVVGPQPETFTLQTDDRFLALDKEYGQDMLFKPRVWRLVPDRQPIHFHSVEGAQKGKAAIRPPQPEELPQTKLLAYGTSITQGGDASAPYLSYMAQTAWRLQADLFNLGMGGSCHCEPQMAEYIAQRDDWDLCVLALSVNMIGAQFTLPAFYERVHYMVKTIAKAHPDKPVFCITIYPHFRDLGDHYIPNTPRAPVEHYRKKLRLAVAACESPKVYLIEGPDILTDLTGLTSDLIHPSDHGMIAMGENLAGKIKSKWN